MDLQPQANPSRPRAWQLAVVITIISAVSACFLLSLGALILAVPTEGTLTTEYSMSAFICLVPGIIALAAGIGTWLFFLRRGNRIRLGARLASWVAALAAAFLFLEGFVIMVQSGPTQLFIFQPTMLPASSLFCLAPALALAWLAFGIRLFANRSDISRPRAIGILLTGILAVLFLGLGVLFSMPTRDGILVPLTTSDAVVMILCGFGPALTLGAAAVGLWMSAGWRAGEARWTRNDGRWSAGARRSEIGTRGKRVAQAIRNSLPDIPRSQFPTISDSQSPTATDPQLPIANSQPPITNLAPLGNSQLPITNPAAQGSYGPSSAGQLPTSDSVPNLTSSQAHTPPADPVQNYTSHLASGDYLVITFDHPGEAIEDARRVVMENAIGLPSQIFTADRQPAGILATADHAILVIGGLDAEAVNRITLAAAVINGASVQEQGRR